MALPLTEMRIDKFLFNVRLFKTRAIAAEACSKGRILVNGTAVKPARNIVVGDEVSVRCNPIYRKYKVLSLLRSRVGASKVAEYMIETTSEEELFKLRALQDLGRFAFGVRDRGTGRPTKKDRREIDEFLDFGDDFPDLYIDDEE